MFPADEMHEHLMGVEGWDRGADESSLRVLFFFLIQSFVGMSAGRAWAAPPRGQHLEPFVCKGDQAR